MFRSTRPVAVADTDGGVRAPHVGGFCFGSSLLGNFAPLVAEFQPEVFCPWVVPTDTHGRSGDMGGRCVALTWSGAVEDRPDWPSD